MLLSGIDKELILATLCGDRPLPRNSGETAKSDAPLTDLEVRHLSGDIIYQVMDSLRNGGVDVRKIANTIGDFWKNENHDAAYLLLVLCYMISDIELPEDALPPIAFADAVESMIYNAYQDMVEYLEDMDSEEHSAEDDQDSATEQL